MFFPFILMVLAIVYLTSRPSRQFSTARAADSHAEQLLRERYVSGEINEETYKKMLRTLRSR